MRQFLLASLLMAAPLLIAVPTSAETLQDAIAMAYSSNPSIAAARAQLRQVDEGTALAASALRPRADFQGGVQQDLSNNLADLGQIVTGGITVRQSIWEGGRIRANISAAEARIAAARYRLSAIEFQILTDTVTAYADVQRTAAIVGLNEGQVKVLEQELRASSDRFEVGDLTRTDVAQSEARFASSRANLTTARAQQITAAQAYRRLVGRQPQALAPLPPLPPLPATPEQALSLATEANPALNAARLDERAAALDVRATRAGRMPSIGVQASANYTQFTKDFGNQSGFDPRVGVSAGMPLFTGGLIAAQVRQAQARQSEALERISQIERQVTEGAINSYEQLRASEAVIQSSRVQVQANALAAEGVRQENQVGSRDILDVLNAEQELLNSRVTLVQAERDRYVAAYRLLESVGNIEPVLAGAPVTRYDPATNARRVRGMGWSEFGADPDPRTDRVRNIAPLTAPLMGPQQ